MSLDYHNRLWQYFSVCSIIHFPRVRGLTSRSHCTPAAGDSLSWCYPAKPSAPIRSGPRGTNPGRERAAQTRSTFHAVPVTAGNNTAHTLAYSPKGVPGGVTRRSFSSFGRQARWPDPSDEAWTSAQDPRGARVCRQCINDYKREKRAAMATKRG